MKVMLGESVQLSDGHWKRAEIELDETDLLRLLIEKGLEREGPMVPAKSAFMILEAQAEILLGAELVMLGALSRETYHSALPGLEARRNRNIEVLMGPGAQ